MKVHLVTNVLHDGETHRADTEADLPDEFAKGLIARGSAVAAGDYVAPAETAAAETAETAPLVEQPQEPKVETPTVPTPDGTTQDEVLAVLDSTEASPTPPETAQNN